FGSVC
ncbi:putative membrane protein, partial [Vibrio parahaemolyticus V-223/04]